MDEQLPILIENSIQIIWSILERSGEIDDPAETNSILVEVVTTLVAKGERRRLMLINRTIDQYRARKRMIAA